MPDEHLRDTLEELHKELQKAGSVDERSRDLLRDVMDDIHAILDPTAPEARPGSLVERLREAVEDFEETHPAVTEAVGRVVDALAKMGI